MGSKNNNNLLFWKQMDTNVPIIILNLHCLPKIDEKLDKKYWAKKSSGFITCARSERGKPLPCYNWPCTNRAGASHLQINELHYKGCRSRFRLKQVLVTVISNLILDRWRLHSRSLSTSILYPVTERRGENDYDSKCD